MASSQQPSWVILDRIATVDDLPPGFEKDVSIRLYTPRWSPASPFRGVSSLPPSRTPARTTPRSSPSTPRSASFYSVPSCGGPIRGSPSKSAAGVVWRDFIESYFVLDMVSGSAHAIPYPGYLKNPANVGVLSVAGRYIVAELIYDPKASFLMCFASHVGEWVKKPVAYPSLPRPFSSDGVLSYNGRLWWIDLSLGLIACDPFAYAPVLSVIPLPEGKGLKVKDASVDQCRVIGLSAGNLHFVDMYHGSDGALMVGVWKLQACPDSTSNATTWSQEHQASLADIWSHENYRLSGLPNLKPVPVFIHPKNNRVIFLLKKRLFVVDFLKPKRTVSCGVPSSGAF